MAHRLSITWQKSVKALRGKLRLRVKFSMRLAVDDIPAIAVGQMRRIVLREGRTWIAAWRRREFTFGKRLLRKNRPSPKCDIDWFWHSTRQHTVHDIIQPQPRRRRFRL